MTRCLKRLWMAGLALTLLASFASAASAEQAAFSFGVVFLPPASRDNTPFLRSVLEQTDSANLAFVTMHGIKSRAEPCSDSLYRERREILQRAGNGLIVAPAASDWVYCKTSFGRSAAGERLMQLRDLLFTGDFSLGGTRLPVLRQSAAPQFRIYGENMRWEVGTVLFATVNLPANNNHYVTDAGRNSEFEDRQVANREWLQRLFRIARYQNMSAIVLFMDGNPLAGKAAGVQRDGYAETRRQIKALAARFPGKVMVVPNPATAEKTLSGKLRWQDNIAVLQAQPGWMRIAVDTASPEIFRAEQIADVEEIRAEGSSAGAGDGGIPQRLHYP